MLAPTLARAIPFGAGEYSIEDFRRNCIKGKWQLWITSPSKPLCVAVSAVIDYPSTKLLYILAMAGSPTQEVIDEAWITFRKFARLTGCSGIEAFGRRGWARSGMLPKGWKHKSDVIYIPLE